MFIQDDKFYNDYDRQVGFNRYKQLTIRHWKDWMLLNLLTILGFLPLAFGISFSMINSSILLLIPMSFIGGMIYGPFLAGIIDAMLRALRDDPMPWFSNYKKSWRQNWLGSLVPGGLFGMVLGIFCFICMLFWYANRRPTIGTVLVLFASALLLTIVFMLYFSQLVLFQQSALNRLRNIALFLLMHFRRCIGVAFLQVAYWTIYVLFAPWTLLLLPVVGVWYIIFLSEFLIYEQLDADFHIEEQIDNIQSADMSC